MWARRIFCFARREARAELSPAQEAAHVSRRKEIYEQINGPAKAIGARASHEALGRGQKVANADSAFATNTAKDTGKSAPFK